MSQPCAPSWIPTGRPACSSSWAVRSEPDRDDNVNARYIVEQADITGVPDDELTQALRDDLQALVGKRLDSGEADRLQERIERELPRYEISRRIRRGSEVGRIRLVYEARKKELPQWLRFEPLRSNALFHSDQGWGSYLDLGIGDRNIRFTPIVAIDNADDLVEEYSGYGLRFETRKLGTRRLGASLEWSRFDPDWRAATLDALALEPGIPAPYDTRSTITPLLKFAFTPDLSVAAGVSISELEPLFARDRLTDGERGGRLDQLRPAMEGRFRCGAPRRGQLRRARRLPRARKRSRLQEVSRAGLVSIRLRTPPRQATGMAGGITGQAPLFERFTLGDSSTLRGWDKYDIAPAGGDRMFYSSIEYRYTGLALFLDIGSVWDAGTERKVRVSTGFGFHAGPAFLVVGFPLNTDNLTAVFTMGLRIPGVGIRW